MAEPVVWILADPSDVDALGHIPDMLDLNDPRSAREQFDDAYRYGGLWRSGPPISIDADLTLRYPGDPPLKPIAVATMRKELIVIYPGAFVAIVQTDHSFVLQRMD